MKLCLLLAVVTSLSTAVTSQVQIPINLQGTYLRPYAETPGLPTSVPLASLGIVPGQWLSVETIGAYAVQNGTDSTTAVTLVFSASGTLLAQNLLDRVPDAIATGPSIPTPRAWYGTSTDIPEDFIAPTLVQVPPSAAWLFISPIWQPSTQGTRVTYNTDPNSDFRVAISVVTPAILQGTAEHAELRTGVYQQQTSSEPDFWMANPGAIVQVDVVDRWSLMQDAIVVLYATVETIGSPLPPSILPGLYLTPTSFPVGAGLVGVSPLTYVFWNDPAWNGSVVYLQAGFVTPQARNGWFMSTNVHRITL